MKIGIIGGTGFYEIDGNEIELESDYGKVIAFSFEKYSREIIFIPRHGKKHKPAHMVNYHANIDALKKAGVEAIIAINTVGSMRRSMEVGSFFIPDDFIDLTGRKSTFYDERAIHVDMSIPFCPVVRKVLMEEAGKKGKVHEGVYIVTNGPRLETKAEINMFKKFAHVVGMTLSPEVILAREAGICYASICLISNYAAGMQERLDVEEIKRIYNERKGDILHIVDECIKKLPEKRECECRNVPERGKI